MKIAILTDPLSASGYRLGGIEVFTAHDTAEAVEVLTRMVQTDEYALIIVNLRLLPEPYVSVRKVMRRRELPILLAVPPHREAVHSSDTEAEIYMRQLIKETTGYEFKI
ncbi:MAG: V-type ATP synthase subunit F [Deltaproteobacteria bacterium]|nr:V-type ATP synthase subunit F [Deltaproteobacteria bacterium]